MGINSNTYDKYTSINPSPPPHANTLAQTQTNGYTHSYICV